MKKFIEKIKAFMSKTIDVYHKIKNWVAVDGLLHIETSTLLFILFQLFLPIYISFVIVLLIGLAKEAIDYWIKKCNNSEQVWHDIVCDLIGILIGILYGIVKCLL